MYREQGLMVLLMIHQEIRALHPKRYFFVELTVFKMIKIFKCPQNINAIVNSRFRNDPVGVDNFGP